MNYIKNVQSSSLALNGRDTIFWQTFIQYPGLIKGKKFCVWVVLEHIWLIFQEKRCLSFPISAFFELFDLSLSPHIMTKVHSFPNSTVWPAFWWEHEPKLLVSIWIDQISIPVPDFRWGILCTLVVLIFFTCFVSSPIQLKNFSTKWRIIFLLSVFVLINALLTCICFFPLCFMLTFFPLRFHS